MRKYKTVIKSSLASLALIISFSSAAFSSDSFKDVPETHWAYKSVNNIVSQGLMVGDLSGNFNPDRYIDKFELSKILAKVTGYKYTNVSDADKLYYNKIYENNKSFIELYSKTFTKWNSTADKEISFLLEKGILKSDDLNQFVIKNTNGVEQLRALSREELAVFMVRIMGKSSEASSYSVGASDKFKDDSALNQTKKQSVYYLRSIGIISGTTDGKFNPKGAVTRADFCVFMDRVLTKMGKTIAPQETLTAAESSNININNISTFSGTIDKYFESLNVVQINIEGGQKLFKVTSAAAIKVDGYLSSLRDLKEGMNVSVVTNNMEIIQLDAVSASSQSAESAQNAGYVSNNSTISVNTTLNETDLTTIYGTIINVSGSNIGLSYKMVNNNTFDSFVSQNNNYVLADNCKITRGNNIILSSDIAANDIVYAKVLGNKIYSLELVERNKTFSATLLDKIYDASKSYPSLVVETKDGKTYEIVVNANTKIKRNNEDETSWLDLKIGDLLNLETDYNKAVSISATGETSQLDGYISQINIGANSSSISICEDSDLKNPKVYKISNESVDIYSLKIGDKVRLNLNSLEVETINLKKAAEKIAFTGSVVSKKGSYILVEGVEADSLVRKKITYDDKTKFISSITGKTIKDKNIEEDCKIYVVFDGSNSNKAKTVTLLSDN